MSLGTLVKVVGGNDQGGVRSCEFAFTSHLRERGFRIFGIILGEGATVPQYLEKFDESVVLDYSLHSFGVGKLKRVAGVLRNEFASSRAGREVLAKVRHRVTGRRIVGVAVRRPYFLKVAGIVGRGLGAPVFWHMCDSVNDPVGRAYYRHLMRRYDLNPIGNSRYTIASLLGAGRQGAYVYPGVWADRIRDDATVPSYRTDLGIATHAAVFAVVARVSPEKATDIVLEAFVSSEPFRNGAHLLIAGGPTDTEFARTVGARARALGRGQVHLLGEIRDVARLYAALDVLVNGRRNAEPFGISIVEAMAAGKPVIAYRLGGPEETIADGATGWLIEEPTVNGYREAYDRAWRARGAWAQMGIMAREAAAAFSTERQVDAYIQLLHSRQLPSAQ